MPKFLTVAALLVATSSLQIQHAVVAAPITFNFVGSVTSVPTQLAGTFSVGQSITGSYTFESTTPDSSALPTLGRYNNSLISATFTVGSYTGTFVSDGNERIEVANNFGGQLTPPDGYSVRGDFTGAGVGSFNPDSFILNLIDNQGTLFSTDALPSIPPDLSLTETEAFAAAFVSVIGGSSTTVSVVGRLASLTLATVPPPLDNGSQQPPGNNVSEPASLSLMGLALLAVCLTRRRCARSQPRLRSSFGPINV